jgi:hypothetical protein
MSDDTLWNLLLHAAHEAPEQVVVHVRGDGSEQAVTLRELLDAARGVAGALRAAGAEPGTSVPLVADRGEDFQVMFWGLVGADVLIVGGGLLTVGATRRVLADGLPPVAAAAEAVDRHWPPETMASCRAESLLHASGADVPLVRGLVDGPTALAYWRAMERTGVTAGPLHLLGQLVRPPVLRAAGLTPGAVTPGAGDLAPGAAPGGMS